MVGGGKMHSPKKRLSTTAVLLAGVALTTAGWLSARSVESTRQEPETKIRVETRLVLVDVVVTDKKGNPVRGLTQEDFALKENGKSQSITVFSWEGAKEEEEAKPALPPLPENVHTNGPDYHKPPGPLTVILVDTVNTARGDQSRVRSELMHYLTEQFRPENRVAILVMGERTEVLQDFTSDPQLLLAALKKFSPKGSALLNLRENITSDDYELMKLALGASMLSDSPSTEQASFLEEIDNFDANVLALSDKERMRKTLEALGGIAHALLRYPGRKNLIWVSAAFPAFYSGGSYRRNQWAMGQELRRVSRLFSDARVSIYAVDPRGLDPAQDKEDMRAFLPKRLTGEGAPPPLLADGNSVTATLRSPRAYLMNSLSAMKALAGNTGGKAFYNRNDLGTAVAEALADGSAYYTLGYNPANEKMDGKFRKIEVKLAKKGYKLRYRRGYYATEPEEEAQLAESDTEAPAEGVSAPDERNLLQLRSALFHPLPPTGLTLYTQVSPPKQPGPASVMVQILVDAKTVTFRDAPGQSQRIDLDFVLAAFTPQGAQLKNSAERFRKTLNPAQHQKVMEGGMLYPMNLRLEPGRYVLRMLVRDNFSGKLGRVDTPLEVAAPEAN